MLYACGRLSWPALKPYFWGLGLKGLFSFWIFFVAPFLENVSQVKQLEVELMKAVYRIWADGVVGEGPDGVVAGAVAKSLELWNKFPTKYLK